jgi:large subunit ribosomal protein L17
MRHRKAGLKLSRKTGHLNSLFRNMVTSLLKHDRIRTTDTKAKELRRWADHLVTLAKRGDLHARRQALSIVQEAGVVHSLFQKAAERFGARSGGYTRLTKLGPRPGDAAPMTLIELIGSVEETKKKKKKAKKQTTKTAASKKKGSTQAVDAKKTAKKSKAAKTGETKGGDEAKLQQTSRQEAAKKPEPTGDASTPAAEASPSDEKPE